MNRVAVVDNDLHNILELALGNAGFCVKAFARADDKTLAALISSPPDLVIADGTNPPLHGFGLVTGLRRCTDTPVLIYSAWADRLFWELLQAGVWIDGFLNKPGSILELAAQARKILIARRIDRQVIGTSPITVLERGPLRVDFERWSCEWKGTPVVLTAVEFAILATLAEPPFLPRKSEALLRAAYEDDVASVGVLHTHVKHIRHRFKLADADCDIIEVLHGVGYRITPLLGAQAGKTARH